MSTEGKPSLYHAKRELIAAQRAIERMSQAQSVEDLEDDWRVFLSAIEKCWIKVERSCQHVRNQFQPWQGRYAYERRKDPLLKYLKHARNSDHHSVQENMDKKAASSSMYVEGRPGVTHIEHLEIKDGQVIEYRGNKPLVIENLPNRVELVPVKDGSKWYNPPRQHRGTKLSWPAPLDVAQLGLEYYKQFVDAAEAEFFEKV